MTTERQQSAIKEVLDQISLDYADQEYLNNLTANLGMDRPPFGFSDDTWRAVVKSLALQYKQIVTKFHDILSILFGPQVTQGGTLVKDYPAGVEKIVLNETSQFPQVGTIVFDEGLSTEETIDYCFIDRSSNTVFLENETVFAHSSNDFDDEQPLVFDASSGDTQLYLPRSIYMPSSFPTTLVIGRGTDNEEVVGITARNTNTGRITISPALSNDHTGVTPSLIQSSLQFEYALTSEYLRLVDSNKFPDNGYVLLGPSNNSITATGGTTTSVSMSAGTIESDRHVGNLFVFDGNVTPSLAGLETEIISNTSSTATFKDALPAAPASGDTFSIRPFVRFTRNVYPDSSLQLSRDLPNVDLAAGTEVELMDINSTALIAPIKVQGTGWDVIQVDSKNVEIFLPEEIQDKKTVLNSSYIHSEEESAPPTTVSTGASSGDTVLVVNDVSDWPPAGNLLIDAGGANEEYTGYRKSRIIGLYDSSGSTPSTINFTGTTFTGSLTGQRVYIEDNSTGIKVSREISSFTGTSVTLVNPLFNNDFTNLIEGKTAVWVYSTTDLEIPAPGGLITSHSLGESVEYYEVIHGSTSLQSGDIWNTDHVFPGPYLYNYLDFAPEGATASTQLTDHLAGPTNISVDQIIGATALEVDNATSFPLGAVNPYQAIVGEFTGNRETIVIDDVNLKSRTSTTVASISNIGDSSIEVSSLSGGGTADTFPNINGYRVLIGKGTANEEIVRVTSTSTGPDTLNVSPDLTSNHSIGEAVELLADVLSVDPLDMEHRGSIKFSNRLSTQVPVGISSTLSISADEGDTVLTLSSVNNFPTLGRIRIDNKEYYYSLATGNKINILSSGGSSSHAVSTVVYVLRNQRTPEDVKVRYEEINVFSTTNFTDEGSLLLNYGKGVLNSESEISSAVTSGDTVLSLVSTDSFPVSANQYEIIIGEGTYNEERALVTNNNVVTDELTINGGSHGVKYSHDVGEIISFYGGIPSEMINYSSRTSTSFRFSSPVVLQSNHSSTETVIKTGNRSMSSIDGFTFPFRMSPNVEFRLEFLLDLIRAAGVQVTIIDSK